MHATTPPALGRAASDRREARSARVSGTGGRARQAGLLALLWPLLLVGEAPAADVAKGRDIAQDLCSSCHAVGPNGASPVAAAPAFRELKRRYPVEDLEESLAEGLTTGHADMPEVALPPESIDAFIAYLQTL